VRAASATTNAIRAACRSDFTSRCAGVQPGGRQALQCLQRNRAQLSQPCQRALAALDGGAPGARVPRQAAPAAATAPTAPKSLQIRQLRLGVLRACAADTRALCGGVEPGGGRIVACLMRNASQLRPQCRAAVAEVRR
jgi:hypothetical protein